MKKKLLHIAVISIVLIILSGFSNSGEMVIPHGKINKSIKKCSITGNIELYETMEIPVNIMGTEILKIYNDSLVLGYVYIKRINSCRSDGCDINFHDDSNGFEYFDYYLITDKSGMVLQVKVYNYQATHGHQVMSKGWLKQFIGYNGSQNMNYGKDVQAISGATVSAKALTEDIQNAEKLISDIINKN